VRSKKKEENIFHLKVCPPLLLLLVPQLLQISTPPTTAFCRPVAIPAHSEKNYKLDNIALKKS